MHPVALIEQLAATSRRREKERILREALLDGCDEFFTGARLAYDPLVIFGVTKVAEIVEDDGMAGDYEFGDFLVLAASLSRQQWNDLAAREAIYNAAARCEAAIWNRFYRRVLLKDLRVGIDAKLINRALGNRPETQKYLIAEFKYQVAVDAAPVHGCKLIDAWLDGVRVLAVLDKDTGRATLFASNGKPITQMPEMQTALAGLMPRVPGSLVLDGVLFSPNGTELTTLLRHREAHRDISAVSLILFDILPLADFRVGYCDRPQRERHAMLEVLQEAGLWAATGGMIHVLPQIEADLDTTAGQTACDEFKQHALLTGHRGVMLKDPNAPYQGRRSAAWVKQS
jgi:DNA ligase-1